MEEQPQKRQHKLSEWLDQLQQESWQLELLISGFAIFLLIGAYGPIHDVQEVIERLSMQSTIYWFLDGPYHALLAAYYILLLSLLLHVALRGLWISTVGLRYVSGDIEYDKLRFSQQYRDWLQHRIGSFDRYIERLEQICSVWFSYTFLLIFSLLGAISFFIFLAAVQFGIRALLGIDLFSGGEASRIDVLLSLILLLFGVIYAFDFLSLGLLKRNRLIGKIYYPIYRLMSWVTLANFYRPLYYNLIDNRFGRRIAYMIIPIILLIIVLMSIRVVKDPYMPYGRGELGWQTHGDWYNENYYEDEVTEVNLYMPSVPSAFPKGSFFQVFIPYIPEFQDASFAALCPEVDVARYAGIKLRGGFQVGEIVNKDSDGDQLLACFQDMYRFHVDDSLQLQAQLRFMYHQGRKQYGLQTVLDLEGLSHGEHGLIIKRQRLRKDSLQWLDWVPIYFWKE